MELRELSLAVQKGSGKQSKQLVKEALEQGIKPADILNDGLISAMGEIGDKFKIPIITKSTFNHKPGTVISDIIEENTIKSIIKKDISRISIVGNGIIRNFNSIHDILKLIEEEKLEILNFEISESKISITFKDIIEDKIVDKFHSIIFK